MWALALVGGDFERRDLQGRSPLYVACYHDRYTCMRALLQNGAQVWTPTWGSQPGAATTACDRRVATA